MVSSRITSQGIPEMMVIVSGQNASYSAMIDCNDGSECTILCTYDSCDGLDVYCYAATCTFGAGSNGSVFTEIDCITNSGRFVALSSGNVVLCPTVKSEVNHYETVDIPREALHQHSIMETIAVTQGNDDCYGEDGCVGDTFDDGTWAICFGFDACALAVFANVEGAQCHGVRACAEGQISGGWVYCNGQQSCASMHYGYERELNVRCSGKASCIDWTKDSSWDVEDNSLNDTLTSFQCSGYESCKNAEITNVETCSGANSCENIVVDTTSTLSCLGNEACALSAVYDNSGDTECFGNAACAEAQLFQSDTVFCDGRESCGGGSIYGATKLYARGERALANA